MFIPDQTRTDFADLLGDDKKMKKLKSTGSLNSRNKLSVFGEPTGGLDLNDDADDAVRSRSERRDMQKNAAKATAGHARNPDRRSFRQMFLGGLILLAVSGGLFSTIWTIVDYLTGASLYPYVDVRNDEETLKKIFFSGDPYVVYCQAGKSKTVPKMLIEGANLLPRAFSTAMLNCDTKMGATDHNVYERFNLDPKGMPAFVVSNGEKPKQFNRESFYNPDYFAEFTKTQTAPKMKEVTNELQFRSACTEKNRCVAFGHKGKMNEGLRLTIESANSHWRKQRFASIDTSRYSIKLDDVLSASVEKQMAEGRTGKHYLSALCFSLPDRTVDTHSPPRAMVRRLLEGDIYYFVKDCMNDVGLTDILKVPTLDVKSASSKKSKKQSQPSEKKKTSKPAPVREEPQSNQYADDGMEVEDLDE